MRSSYRSVRLKSASDSSCHAVPIFVTQWLGLDALERHSLLLSALVAGASVEGAASCRLPPRRSTLPASGGEQRALSSRNKKFRGEANRGSERGDHSSRLDMIKWPA